MSAKTFLQEVTIVGMETIKLDDSTLLKVNLIENVENTPNRVGAEIGVEWSSKAELFSMFANEMPMKATLEFGVQRNSKQRSEMKILNIQKGWKTEKNISSAVDKIAENGK